MDPQNHPYRTGCLIGLILAVFKYPGPLGCVVLLAVAVAVLLVAAAAWLFLDWLPWSGLAVVVVAAGWWYARKQNPRRPP
jgi:hypothetical protein